MRSWKSKWGAILNKREYQPRVLVPVSPLLSSSPATEIGPVGSHHFKLALETGLYEGGIAMTTRIRKGKTLSLKLHFRKTLRLKLIFLLKRHSLYLFTRLDCYFVYKNWSSVIFPVSHIPQKLGCQAWKKLNFFYCIFSGNLSILFSG